MDVGVAILTGLAARDYAASLSYDGFNEDGPFGLLTAWRKVGAKWDTSKHILLHTLGYAMLCPVCLSFWLGILLLIVWAISPTAWAVAALPGAVHKIAMLARQIEEVMENANERLAKKYPQNE